MQKLGPEITDLGEAGLMAKLKIDRLLRGNNSRILRKESLASVRRCARAEGQKGE